MSDEKKPSSETIKSSTGDNTLAGSTPSVAPAAKPKPSVKPPPEPPKGPVDPLPPDDLESPSFVKALQARMPDTPVKLSYWVGDWTAIIPLNRLIEVARFLRDDSNAAFDYCSDITATDWPPRTKRFDVLYCLYSTRLRHRIRIKVQVGETDTVPSVTELWSGANWLEREVYDQFGVNFGNHPDLRRILMPDEWQGHPQRKDYPLEGPGEFLMENPQDWLRIWDLPNKEEIE